MTTEFKKMLTRAAKRQVQIVQCPPGGFWKYKIVSNGIFVAMSDTRANAGSVRMREVEARVIRLKFHIQELKQAGLRVFLKLP